MGYHVNNYFKCHVTYIMGPLLARMEQVALQTWNAPFERRLVAVRRLTAHVLQKHW
jgi:hypothetical protein